MRHKTDGPHAPLVDTNIWRQKERHVEDPDTIRQILRYRAFEPAALLPYIDILSQRYGIDLPYFRSLALYGFVFQSGQAHLAQRRSVAAAFSAGAVQMFAPQIKAGVDACIARLANRTEADLFTELCEPSFVPVMRAFIGLPHGSDDDVITLVRTANDASHPMLSLSALQRIETAMAGLANHLAQPGEDHGTLIGTLRDQSEDEDYCVGVALSSLIAAHTMVQTLARAIYGLLLDDRAGWVSAGSGLQARDVDHLLMRFASTQTLVRVAADGARIDGCPVSRGETIVLDIVAANRCARRQRRVDGGGLAFGAGVHKCPGEALSRQFISYALPALARAFPRLGLHRDRVRHHVTPLVRYPRSLPCELAGRNRRVSSRLIEILESPTARALINDDLRLGPPELHLHLDAIQDRTGHDLSPAIKIARNAMFFMSGPRHNEARKQVAQVLGGNRMTRWQPLVDGVVEASLDTLQAHPNPDLIRDFAMPVFQEIMQALLGVSATDRETFDKNAPILQDVLEPLLPARRILELQTVFNALLKQMQDPPAWVRRQVPLLRHLYDCELDGFDRTDCQALTLVLYGASFNLVHTFGNIVHQILEGSDGLDKAERRLCLAEQVDRLIGSAASPRYIYRVARMDLSIDGLEVKQGDTVRMQLLSINLDADSNHLSFGHGLHHCVGAAVTRLVLKSAIPSLFQRFPKLSLLAEGIQYHHMSQTVAPSHLPCRLHE